MVMDEHIYTYRIKSKGLLEKQGHDVEDHHLKTREEPDAFKEKPNFKTTPQAFTNEKRIGGYINAATVRKAVRFKINLLRIYQLVDTCSAGFKLLGGITYPATHCVIYDFLFHLRRLSSRSSMLFFKSLFSSTSFTAVSMIVHKAKVSV